MIMPFYDGEIEIIIRRFVCAQCYLDLKKRFAPDRKWIAFCPVHGDIETVGRITRSSAERLGQKLVARRKEIIAKFPEEYPSPHKGKSTEQLIEEMGF
jgi:hypothetical protein